MFFLEELDYKSLFDYNPDTILTLDNCGIIIQVNQAFSKRFGYATEELLFKSYELLVHPHDLEEVQSLFNQVIQGTVQEFETQAFDKNGRLIILFVKTIPIVIEGKVNGAFWVAKDITNFKKTIDDLYQTEKKFEEIFNQTADAINIIDLHGNVLEVNPAFEIMYGWKENEILGTPLPTIPPDKLMETQEFVNKINQNETIKDFETTRIRKDGSYIEINLTYSPIHDSNGTFSSDSWDSKRYNRKEKK
jgi:PAS domain S-box-containing protein